jgi:hypothetical protein
MQHGEDMRFLLHTKDLTEKQIDGLKNRYANLIVKNSETDWDWLGKVTGMSKQQLLRGKRQVEQLGNKYMSREFYHWKHYISIYSRYKDAIKDAFNVAGEGEHILHLDADLYINRPINAIFNLIKIADVALILRPGLIPEWRKTYGCVMGYTVNKASRKFMKNVRTHIRAVDYKNIPKGYGQIVFWRAYCDYKQNKSINFAAIPQGWIQKDFSEKALILSANNGLMKRVTAKRYKRRYQIKRGK